ncbi:uncharacterized protein N7483_006330 [Penicillium malachiteum]|uniref:uncharacterized protein n=1 Tax=Penicillium malachiteum TaxID=1324776 RepID=UPI00254853BE|nr:uncharacterized protein N7483_006330 [Penicillium malachiteum]KAJ5724973.1 hypothetical protein N7483_006330 [Penicillium malachiteum]
MEPFGPSYRWFELYSHRTESVRWTVSSESVWVRTSLSSGTLAVAETTRIHVTVDWDQVPAGFDAEGLLEVRSDMGDFDYVHVPVQNREAPAGFVGFIECDRHVSINAPHLITINTNKMPYDIFPHLSRTGVGSVGLKRPIWEADNLPSLQYPFFTFHPASDAILTLYFTMTMNFEPENPLKYDLCVDKSSPSTQRFVPDAPSPGDAPPGDLPAGWFEECPTGAWTRRHTISLAKSGAHLIQIRLRNCNCLLEKLVIDLGGARKSYLGPSESMTLGIS